MNLQVRTLLIALGSLSIVFLTGCPITDSIDRATNEIDLTRQTIANQSEAWRAELPKLVDQLNMLEGQTTADAKGVIADASAEVQALVTDSVKYTSVNAEEIVAKTGSEFRCNIDFVDDGILPQLQFLIDDLEFWKLHKQHLDKKPVHKVCQIVEDNLPLYSISGGGFGIDSSKLLAANQVDVFGYNFRGNALPTLQLVDAQAHVVREMNIIPAYVTQYQLKLDFSTESFIGATVGSRIQFVWPDKAEPNSISLSLLNPSKIKITGVAFDPASPVVSKDAVSITVSLVNQGEMKSGPFVVDWKPGDGAVKSITELPFDPSETRQVKFPYSYTFQQEGQNLNFISLSNGDDTLSQPITVRPRFFLASTTSDVFAGGGPGGNPFRDPCPANTVGVGFQGRSGNYIDQIQLLCAPLKGNGTGAPPTSTPPQGKMAETHFRLFPLRLLLVPPVRYWLACLGSQVLMLTVWVVFAAR